MSLSSPNNYAARLAILATMAAATPSCIDQVEGVTIESTDGANAFDASIATIDMGTTVEKTDVANVDDASIGTDIKDIGDEVSFKSKNLCPLFSETCGHSKSTEADLCASVDKQDFADELSVEMDKALQIFEKIIRSIEANENLADLSSKVKHTPFGYSLLEVNTDEFYMGIFIHNENQNGVNSVRLSRYFKPISGGTGGNDLVCRFDASGKPLSIELQTPFLLDPSDEQCDEGKSTDYFLFGDQGGDYLKAYYGNNYDNLGLPNAISEFRHRETKDEQSWENGCACGQLPIQCPSSKTSIDTGCTVTPGTGTGWSEVLSREMDPQAAQSLLERLTALVEELLKKHGIHS
ncbi:hypothetical protein M0P48_00495 [Candidatus Gracilibacteria bacterium]|jgi:hypothetical protein|nr:hypothetical protein [Candidatus Gracilibacteria bacterium]